MEQSGQDDAPATPEIGGYSVATFQIATGKKVEEKK